MLTPRPPGTALRRPRPLRPADLVEVITPAGPMVGRHADRLAAGIAVLESWGLRVRRPRALSAASLPWLAGADDARAEQLTAAWLDDEVSAVWMARGGFGSSRIVDLVDWERLAQARPKTLVGFSDVTVLHQAVAARLGLASVHGAGVAGLGDRHRETNEASRSLVMAGRAPSLTGRGIGDRAASGPLTGGNLSTLAHLVGAAGLRPATGQVVALEDVDEHPYRLDRALTQLLRAGWLDGAVGVVLGDFTDCGDPGQVAALLAERLTPLGVPLLFTGSFGHEQPNLPLPLGVVATVDPVAGTLSFEPQSG